MDQFIGYDGDDDSLIQKYKKQKTTKSKLRELREIEGGPIFGYVDKPYSENKFIHFVEMLIKKKRDGSIKNDPELEFEYTELVKMVFDCVSEDNIISNGIYLRFYLELGFSPNTIHNEQTLLFNLALNVYYNRDNMYITKEKNKALLETIYDRSVYYINILLKHGADIHNGLDVFLQVGKYNFILFGHLQDDRTKKCDSIYHLYRKYFCPWYRLRLLLISFHKGDGLFSLLPRELMEIILIYLIQDDRRAHQLSFFDKIRK